jgi:hypothetical protein
VFSNSTGVHGCLHPAARSEARDTHPAQMRWTFSGSEQEQGCRTDPYHGEPYLDGTCKDVQSEVLQQRKRDGRFRDSKRTTR